MKTGMEPWFAFWSSVRDSIAQFKALFQEREAYLKAGWD